MNLYNDLTCSRAMPGCLKILNIRYKVSHAHELNIVEAVLANKHKIELR